MEGNNHKLFDVASVEKYLGDNGIAFRVSSLVYKS